MALYTMACRICSTPFRHILIHPDGSVLSPLETKLFLRELDFNSRIRTCTLCSRRCIETRPVFRPSPDGFGLCVQCSGDQMLDPHPLYQPVLLHSTSQIWACPIHGEKKV